MRTSRRGPRARCFRTVALALACTLAGCTTARSPHSPAYHEPGVDAPGPLPNARRSLERRIADGEQAIGAGFSVNSARLAHLRMTRRALDLIESGEDERAMDLLERAIAVDGSTGYAYLYLGYLHLRHGRVAQARVFLDRAAALLPSDPALEAEVEALRADASADATAAASTPAERRP